MNFDITIREDLWKAIEAHYERNDFTEAVRDSVFHMSEVLREKGGVEDKDGSKLVDATLFGKEPTILINKNETTTEKDYQQGIGFAFKGIMQAVRNPLSHEKFEYTQEEAIEIILYINFLLNQVDKSGGMTKFDSIIDLLMDEDFTDTKEYADLLLKEVPLKKRYDLLLELYQNRSELPEYSLQHFLDALFNSLTKEAQKNFIRVVSASLMKCKDDNDLRMYFHYFMQNTYSDIEKLAQLRIEDLILKSIRKGEVSYNTQKECIFYGGSLATWISDSINYELLGNKDEIYESLLDSLMSGESKKENYVFEYFSELIFLSTPRLKPYQINFIKAKLKEGSEKYINLLSFDMDVIKEKSEWYNLFKDEYNEGKKIIEENSDLPF